LFWTKGSNNTIIFERFENGKLNIFINLRKDDITNTPIPDCLYQCKRLCVNQCKYGMPIRVILWYHRTNGRIPRVKNRAR
jgi:hypothetical protein